DREAPGRQGEWITAAPGADHAERDPERCRHDERRTSEDDRIPDSLADEGAHPTPRVSGRLAKIEAGKTPQPGEILHMEGGVEPEAVPCGGILGRRKLELRKVIPWSQARQQHGCR